MPDGEQIDGVTSKKITPFKPSFKGTEGPVTWSISPNLPEGMEFNADDGNITGQSNDSCNLEFQITVTDHKKTDSATVNLRILDTVPVNTQALVSTLAEDGNTIGHGICEFIDNSIDGDSTEIDAKYGFEELKNKEDSDEEKYHPWVIIRDNGKGIGPEDEKVSYDSLKRALGSGTSPDQDYCMSRLGAFGIGLPAAALSTSYYCTIFSKNSHGAAIAMMALRDLHRTNSLRFFPRELIPDFLTSTDSYTEATKQFEEMETGTIILLQNTYSISNIIGNAGVEGYQNFKTGMRSIMGQCKNYLRLVYHHFLTSEGVTLHKSDSTTVTRKIKIFWQSSIPLTPIDPLLQNLDNGSQKGTLTKSVKNLECTIEGETRLFNLKMAVLPGKKDIGGIGRTDADGTSHDKSIESALLMYQNPQPFPVGSEKIKSKSAKVGIQNAQGLYFYRNYRLIEFGTWRGLYSENVNGHQYARVAVHVPLGIPKKRPGGLKNTNFTVNPRKTKMLAYQPVIEDTIGDQVRATVKWHTDDPRPTTLYNRGKQRKKWDGKKGGKSSTPKPPKPVVIDPGSISDQRQGYQYRFEDKTQGVPKNVTRKWKINQVEQETIQNGKAIEGTMDEIGEKIVFLEITSNTAKSNKKWQGQISFEIVENDDDDGDGDGGKGGDDPKKEMDLVVQESNEDATPLIFDELSNKYIVNKNSNKLNWLIEKLNDL